MFTILATQLRFAYVIFTSFAFFAMKLSIEHLCQDDQGVRCSILPPYVIFTSFAFFAMKLSIEHLCQDDQGVRLGKNRDRLELVVHQIEENVFWDLVQQDSTQIKLGTRFVSSKPVICIASWELVQNHL
ncbi:hypothetical protein VNO77_24384 [Canavalia gladiata]|uniref:Uncharacterized protein n=1 Tax=Canavalia gladiata TaxID=3824 RepID=A0AAN9QCK4_CANGL